MSVRKLLATAHGWAGAISALFIVLVAGSGTLLAFMGEMFLWQHGDMLRTSTQEGRPYASATQIIDAAVEGYAQPFQTMGILMPHTRVQEVETALVFGLPEGGKSEDDLVMLSADPWRVEYKGSFVLNNTFGHELIDFHHDLLLGDTGKFIVSIVAVLLVLMSISGLWLWWPKGLGNAWRKTKTPGRFKASKTYMFSLHGFTGFWLLLGVMYFSATGVGLSKPDWFGPLLTPVSHIPPNNQAFGQQCQNPLSIDKIEETAQQQFPHSRLSILFLPNQPNGPYMLNYMASDDINMREGDKRIFVHASCEGVYHIIDLSNESASTRAAGMMLSLHGGYSFGKILGDIFVLLSGLGLLLLSVTGIIVFLTKTLRIKL